MWHGDSLRRLTVGELPPSILLLALLLVGLNPTFTDLAVCEGDALWAGFPGEAAFGEEEAAATGTICRLGEGRT